MFFNHQKMKKCEVDVKKEGCRRMQQNRHNRIFAMIAKISLGLRKFRYLAKFTVPSEIFQFLYLTKISLG